MKYSNLNELAVAFLKSEFEKNVDVNYLVRCSDTGDGELDQIMESDSYILINENIPDLKLRTINQMLEEALEEEDYDMLDEVADLVRPYLTFSELYENDFDTWEAIVCETYDLIGETV